MASQQISRKVVKKLEAIATAEGVGATVRRSIGGGGLNRLDPFLMLDHFHLRPGAGFPDHPHRGQATVTYMLEGSVQHEDSVGNAGTIGAGDLQWMIAGKGIIHAEMPVHGPGLPDPVGLQLWVDLPRQHKMTQPSYQELTKKNIPNAFPEGPDGPSEIVVISGKSHGIESPVRHLGGCWYLDIKLKTKGATVFQDIPTGWTAFFYTLSGSLTVNGKAYEPFYTLVLSSGEQESGVSMTAAADNTRVVLIAGEPLNQPVVQMGPFVMNTKEGIQKTLLDYRMGKNGFERSMTWKSKIGDQ
ncbi:hypothetical protein FRB96_001224 [Tulasnella sp. 330]|nr:hypothetical protein FRB96_001224 [Tulasnella sp. 330]KAG8883346.1 hypothetical protein FRB97_006771 [Tulasnella sp. 331]